MTDLGREYAESLFLLALEDGKEKEYFEELTYVNSVVSSEPEFAELLSSPALTREERCGAVEKVFEGGLSEYVMSFLKLLAERGHVKLLGECAEEYGRMYREAMKKAAVKVTSAAPLTEDEKRRIASKISRIVKGDSEITYLVDPSLLGGAVIETEDAVIDGSLKKSLHEMKEVIKK